MQRAKSLSPCRQLSLSQRIIAYHMLITLYSKLRKRLPLALESQKPVSLMKEARKTRNGPTQSRSRKMKKKPSSSALVEKRNENANVSKSNWSKSTNDLLKHRIVEGVMDHVVEEVDVVVARDVVEAMDHSVVAVATDLGEVDVAVERVSAVECPVEDHAVEHMLAIRAVAAHWGELAPREQRILRMRFRCGSAM